MNINFTKDQCKILYVQEISYTTTELRRKNNKDINDCQF